MQTTTKQTSNNDLQKLLKKSSVKIPQSGDAVKGIIISASKAKVQLDIDGMFIGVVRGPELYVEADEYSNLKPGDEIEATVIDEENENGELELSFKCAGQKKAWNQLVDAFENQKTIKVKSTYANKGGLVVSYYQIQGFLPVSHLAPEHYPRIGNEDKSKILEKLKLLVDKEFEVKINVLDKDDRIVFSERDAWKIKKQNVMDKYKIGSIVDGVVNAVTHFGIFINFGKNLEGLIHVSELSWGHIDNPVNLFKKGDKIKAQITNIDGFKIFLSAKKLLKDPWKDIEKKYKPGKIMKGSILKIHPFGLIIKLDDNIHGLAHFNDLNLNSEQQIKKIFKINDKATFEILSIDPKQHRLALKLSDNKTLPSASIDQAKKIEDKKTLKN
ncbi:MAG: S1 RNA-binding domain-containing protein [Patescibacteria group bacterium]|nr:S1 RNA-binding domain-containing protein [Patescibacteria group bacterium]MBU1160666.1 S1 RNA-binding domain-containing protein [Patescibacteria group bacterium]MBU1349639.1 S1 RNA-binding domain-containing protein [Patescibacteria group bacterium]MBU1421275.1 S1 RNA-binding domain-containing protein [Patescibacteria group bacterium]MBU1684033.1 S1 RNA-binding domain-containing protein [Patescibacteria group bacterium]